jgi:probable HAF family extracellular repeat protein
MQDLGELGGGWSSAVAINNRGQVVGWSQDASGFSHFVLWQAGVMSDLGENIGTPRDINDLGQIVGGLHPTFVGGSLAYHAFLYQGGAVQDLGTLEGGHYSFATAINNAGQVVGSSDDAAGRAHPVLWAGGAITPLPELGVGCDAFGINDAGQIAGSCHLDGGASHAVLWQSGSITDLGTLGGNDSYARAISPGGEVVGESSSATGEGHAFLWTARDGMQDINPGAATESYAVAINGAAQIVGVAVRSGHPDATVWTIAGAAPTP